MHTHWTINKTEKELVQQQARPDSDTLCLTDLPLSPSLVSFFAPARSCGHLLLTLCHIAGSDSAPFPLPLIRFIALSRVAFV